jgi:hypothetical protein
VPLETSASVDQTNQETLRPRVLCDDMSFGRRISPNQILCVSQTIQGPYYWRGIDKIFGLHRSVGLSLGPRICRGKANSHLQPKQRVISRLLWKLGQVLRHQLQRQFSQTLRASHILSRDVLSDGDQTLLSRPPPPTQVTTSGMRALTVLVAPQKSSYP